MAHIIESQFYNINKIIISSNRNCEANDILWATVNYLEPKFPGIDFWDELSSSLYMGDNDDDNKDFDDDSEDEDIIRRDWRVSIIRGTNMVYIDECICCHGIRWRAKFTIYTINGEHDSEKTRELYENLKSHIESIYYTHFEDSFIIEPPGEVL